MTIRFTSTTSDSWTELIPTNNSSILITAASQQEPVDDFWFYIPGQVFSRPIHALLLGILIAVAAILNGLIIYNIRKHELKSRTITFILIEYMCLLDFVGAVIMLPFPFHASVNGGWTLGSTICSINAAINVGVWIQHFALFILLKIDRTLASCLPIGRYPLFTARFLQLFIVFSLVFSFSMSTTVTLVCGSRFHNLVLMCTPCIPRVLYTLLTSCYVAFMLAATVSYLLIIFYLKLQQRKIYSVTNLQVKDYRHNINSAVISLHITVTNLVVTAPVLLVLGRPDIQALLHPLALLIVDAVFYSEFFLHPLILLFLSTRLRKEVKHTVKSFVKQFIVS